MIVAVLGPVSAHLPRIWGAFHHHPLPHPTHLSDTSNVDCCSFCLCSEDIWLLWNDCPVVAVAEVKLIVGVLEPFGNHQGGAVDMTFGSHQRCAVGMTVSVSFLHRGKNDNWITV